MRFWNIWPNLSKAILNQSDVPFDPDTLASKLSDKEGALITLSDKIDATLLSHCPKLKAVCNIAVGYNNIDLQACTNAKVLATNTPGCWMTPQEISPGL